MDNKLMCDCTTCVKRDVCDIVKEYKELIEKVEKLCPSNDDYHIIIQCKHKFEESFLIKR